MLLAATATGVVTGASSAALVGSTKWLSSGATDAAQAQGWDNGPTTVSHLLLSSDLAGIVEDPDYCFREAFPTIINILSIIYFPLRAGYGLCGKSCTLGSCPRCKLIRAAPCRRSFKDSVA
nr:hypothetical protein [Tanacetum cinerariifolium]